MYIYGDTKDISTYNVCANVKTLTFRQNVSEDSDGVSVNRRSIKTRNEITEAFLLLLAEKPIRSITVKEIADKADITRATFYSHYSDIYDLLESTRAEAVDHVRQLLDRAIAQGDVSQFSLDLFTYFDERQELFALIMGENGDMSFLVNVLHELRLSQAESLKQQGNYATKQDLDETSLDRQFLFISGGVLHVLTDWLSRENREPVEEIAAATAEFLNGCLCLRS